MITRLALFALLVGIAFSCSQQPKPEEGDPIDDQPQERVQSELVLLMLQMEAHIKSLKERQGRGDSVLPADFIDYAGMLTLATTRGMNRDAAFDKNAIDWMNQLKALTEAAGSDQEEIYNGLINSCVTCHKNYCPGPIKRIEKLHI